jgi:hypothetical protein
MGVDILKLYKDNIYTVIYYIIQTRVLCIFQSVNRLHLSYNNSVSTFLCLLDMTIDVSPRRHHVC